MKVKDLQNREDLVSRYRLLISGRVQGVGFRPAVYRLAKSLHLTGFVYNDSKGVTIEVQGKEEEIAEFVERLRGKDKPTLSQIKDVSISNVDLSEGEEEFTIKESKQTGAALSEVTADIAVCEDCLSEMRDAGDFRYRYPFINCTNCGPRYSIVKTIPYDRCNTTMSVFAMCEKCSSEYNDMADRRFHAQPVACGKCGPSVRLNDNKAKVIEGDSDKAIAEAARLLSEGKILAIKGVGGFHLAADALNETAVQKLRLRKRRDHKPFALMAETIDKIRKYAVVSKEAERILKSPESPIVLLPKKKDSLIAPSVAESVDTFGFMLCYAPLHYLLFAEGPEVLVMTSGNISDEPLICKDEKAAEKLSDVVDAFLMHDREIYRQIDDSIVHFIEDEPVLLRRARGYVPTPFVSEKKATQDILAAGADMKNTFCFVKQNQLICSEHIGDLEDADVYHHYINSIEHMRRLFGVEPKVIACDLHPGYFSSQYALTIPNVKKIRIQHHWAHIASVLAEHNTDGPVIGLSVDGTGYGADGAIWGCECLIASLKGFERFGHLDYYKLAGADKASKEAERSILGLLIKTYGSDFELKEFGWLLERIEPDYKKTEIISEQIDKNINTIETSSMGRIFDAVAAMAGLGSYNYFEAQLPMALEAVIKKDVEQAYDFELIEKKDEPLKLDLRKMVRQVVDDVKAGIEGGIISAKFHNCIAEGLFEMVLRAQKKTELNTAALSGGVFCNRYLTGRLIKLLKKNDFHVLFNRQVPSNDGGISLGQAAITVARYSSPGASY